MSRTRTAHKVRMYGIFITGVCVVSIFHVLGYSRLLEQTTTTRRLASPLCLEQDNESLQEEVEGWGIYRLALNDTGGAPPQSAERVIQEEMLSPPQLIFLDYMRRHSVDALRRDTAEEFGKRKFAIAYYSCPHQLGNRLFHFMNNLLWAVITDRTVLYKYMDKSTCEQLKEVQPMLYLNDAICQAANSVQDCDTVMERAPWLPSYDEFVDPSWEIHLVDFWQTHWYRVSPQWIRDRYVYDERIHSNLTKVDQIVSKLVEFPALTNVETATLTGRFTRQELLETSDARMTARKLVNKGLRFTYGMFFSEMFRLRNEEIDLVKNYYPKENDKESNIFSIALHSRHKHVKQKGHNIQNEQLCLAKVLANRPRQQPCQVCAMSDRPLALETLKTWLEQEQQCKLIQIRHPAQTRSFSVEHGPNAGAAFARELDVCHRYGRQAVVTTSTGSGASSSALLESLVDYKNNNKMNKRPSRANNTETQYCNEYST